MLSTGQFGGFLAETRTHFKILDHEISLTGNFEEIFLLEFEMSHIGVISDLFDDLETIYLYIPSIKAYVTL